MLIVNVQEDCDTDELNCGNCTIGQFTCDNGTCLDSNKVCDGKRDCFDNEDENHPDCGMFQFSSECYFHLLIDLVHTTPTTEAPTTTLPPTTTEEHCAPGMMVCDNGECVTGGQCDDSIDVSNSLLK